VVLIPFAAAAAAVEVEAKARRPMDRTWYGSNAIEGKESDAL
jgi:hypothetical protein